MLEYLIPEGTDTADARRLLTGKGEADLRAQGATLFETLKRINAACKVTNDKGEETGFDYQASDELTGADSDRNAQLMRMTAERKAIREELRERADRALIQHEIDSPLPALPVPGEGGNANGGGTGTGGALAVNPSLSIPPHLQMEMAVEAMIGNYVQALVDQSGSGASFDPVKGARPFLETHRSISIPGLTPAAIIGAQFGHPRSQMTQTGTNAGYKPFSYRDLREALLTSQINNYTGMLERRSTEGQLKINYLQETTQSLSAAVVKTQTATGNEAGQANESTFTVTEATVDLRKLITKMDFSVEELRSRADFVGFLTTRIIRAVANTLESQLISGDNNKVTGGVGSGQLHGLDTYEAGADQTQHQVGVDLIEGHISTIENVAGQMATAILMEHTSISAIRQWHVRDRTSTTALDARYVIADPTTRGPLMLWDVPVVRVPVLTAKDVYVIDSMPIVCYDRGDDMNVRFTDSDGTNFTRDVMTAVASVWANAAYTRSVPAIALTSQKYVQRIKGFENVHE